MALTLEEYKALRGQGLDPKQIAEQQASSQPQMGGGFGSFVGGFGKGAAKGAATTLQNIGQATIAAPSLLPGGKSFTERLGEVRDTTGFRPETLKPKGLAEQLGFGAERIAEFLAPSTQIAKLTRGGSLLTRAATESATFGTITLAQTGKAEEATTAAIIGAAFPVAGATVRALRPAGGIRKAVGEKIQQTVIRPTQRDVKDGFKISNINRFDLGGSLEETATKTHIAINKRVQDLNKLLKGTEGNVDIRQVLNATKEQLKTDGFKRFGSIKAFQRAVKDLETEIKAIAPKNNKIDLVQATLMKRGAGTKSAWAFGQPDRDAKALQNVYSRFYLNLKEATEKAAGSSGSRIKSVNKELSELIPISNAVIRRLPIEQRNNIISLTDSIGLFSAVFDPRALALIGANKLSKSGKFGAFLVRTGANAAQKASREPTSAVGQRFLGGRFSNLIGR